MGQDCAIDEPPSSSRCSLQTTKGFKRPPTDDAGYTQCASPADLLPYSDVGETMGDSGLSYLLVAEALVFFLNLVQQPVVPGSVHTHSLPGTSMRNVVSTRQRSRRSRLAVSLMDGFVRGDGQVSSKQQFSLDKDIICDRSSLVPAT